mgnify:CR=1 FL=1
MEGPGGFRRLVVTTAAFIDASSCARPLQRSTQRETRKIVIGRKEGRLLRSLLHLNSVYTV